MNLHVAAESCTGRWWMLSRGTGRRRRSLREQVQAKAVTEQRHADPDASKRGHQMKVTEAGRGCWIPVSSPASLYWCEAASCGCVHHLWGRPWLHRLLWAACETGQL